MELSEMLLTVNEALLLNEPFAGFGSGLLEAQNAKTAYAVLDEMVEEATLLKIGVLKESLERVAIHLHGWLLAAGVPRP